MNIISFSSNKQGISIVHTTGKKTSFSILYHILVPVVPGDWVALAKSIDSLIQSRHQAAKITRFIVVKAGAGKYAAAADTYKAEGIVEYVLGNLGFAAECISKQSLAKGLGCAKKEKWQDKAAAMFNGEKSMKRFSQGLDAACAGAWSAAS